jgi:hypothetical protein
VGAIDSGVRESGTAPRITWPPIAQSWSVRARRPALQGLFAFVIYLIVFIAGFAQPLIAHPRAAQVGQIEVDPNFYIWAWRWWPYAVSHGLNPLYSTQIGAPSGYSLAWATTSPPVALLMWPVTATFGPVASFNLTLLLAPPLSAWATFIVARRLTERFWASLFGGVVFGFNLYEISHETSGLVNLTVTFLLPLMVYLVVLWWQGSLGTIGYVIWMTIAMALEFYTFMEAFAEMTVLWVAALVIALAIAWRTARRTVARLAALTAIGYAAAVVLAAPYLFYALRHYPAALTRQTGNYSLDLADFIVPKTDRLLGLNWLAPTTGHLHSQYEYIGIPLLLVLIGLAVFTWSSRVTRFLVIMFIIVIALGAGPNLMIDGSKVFPLPWGGLWSLPVARSAEPTRFIDFGYLVLGLVLAVWLAAPVRSRVTAAARWGLAVLALAAIFANLPTFAEVVVPPPPAYQPAIASLTRANALPSFITDGLYEKYLRPGETVVVISERGNAGMLFQAQADFYFRIAGGFINASLTPVYAIPPAVELLSRPTPARVKGFRAYLGTSGVGAIIVERAWSQDWMYVFGKLGMRSTTVGGVTIFSPVHAKAKT